MRYLAFLLLAPWLIILAWAYWNYPRSLPRHGLRRLFDAVVVLLALVVAAEMGLLVFDRVVLPRAGPYGVPSGSIWQQVLPVLVAYGVFVVVLALGLWLRHLSWGRPRRENPPAFPRRAPLEGLDDATR